jgi:pimeloyl-ACP methyl ester carboxylesterase
MATRPDRLVVIRSLRVPVLVIAGEEDAIVPEADSRAMAEAASLGELIVIPGAGHLSPMEAPGATDAAIQSFLSRLS